MPSSWRADLKALIGLRTACDSPKQPELQAVWDGLRPTREDREVKLHIDEPEDLADKLLTMLGGGRAQLRETKPSRCIMRFRR